MTFDEWIHNTFEHPVTDYWIHWTDVYHGWDGPAATIVSYLTQTFENADTVLQPFSDGQVNQGLHYLISNLGSGYSYVLLDTTVPLAARLRCIGAMAALFDRCFARRCSSHLSHLDEPGRSPLNSICYMWWDVLPLHGLAHHKPDHPDGSELDHAILNVIRHTFEIEAVACQESGVIGVCEWSPYYDETGEMIEDFLIRNPGIRPELRAFALRFS